MECLGASVGDDSYISVVRTTDFAPGSAWTGTKISGADNKSNMNGGAGALGTGSHTIYYNIKVDVPVGATGYSSTYGGLTATPAADTPVLTIRYTWN